MGGAKLAPNPFIPCKNPGFGLFWPNWNNHGAISPADKNWDRLIGVQALNQALKLLYPGNVSIRNPDNDIARTHPRTRQRAVSQARNLNTTTDIELLLLAI
jgi:hypothetical protein